MGLGALIYVFVSIGWEAILESRDGRIEQPITDSSLPGFQVLVEPTPSTIIVHVHGDELVGVVVSSLAAADRGGTVLFVPAETVIGGDPTSSSVLADVHAEGGVARRRRSGRRASNRRLRRALRSSTRLGGSR